MQVWMIWAKPVAGDVVQHLAAIALGLLSDQQTWRVRGRFMCLKTVHAIILRFVIPRFNARKHVFICGCLACFFLYSYFVDTGLSIVAKIRSKNFVIKQNTAFPVRK